MKGNITIEASEHGYGIDVHVDDMCTLDKLELMHALAVSLRMNDEEMELFMLAEHLGIMTDAEQRTACTDADQIQRLLRGEQPEGITIDMTELRRQLHES